ncbi:MAG: glutamate--cysteine ligase [Legionellales bacterium]|nr:glutamate--cysteine ligase [Legionellales bacterium]
MNNINDLSNSQSLASISNIAHEEWLNIFVDNQSRINEWFDRQFSIYPPPLYASVDLRFAGYKLAPVDTNLFSAGFNNISKTDYPLAISAIKEALLKRKLPANWLLIPENHTRNLAYWENVHILQQLFSAAGCQIKIGSLLPELHTKKTLSFTFGEIELHPLTQGENGLIASDFQAEAILLNNDFAEGIPVLFKNARHPIYPPPQAGWHRRRKSQHAYFYQEFAKEFAEFLNINSWLISTIESRLDNINLENQETLDALAEKADHLFMQVDAEYQRRHIAQSPFVMLKADAGTYGQAVISVASREACLNLTRKQKQEMRFTKGKQPVDAVLLQEGVYTAEFFSDNHIVAEPVIYLIDGKAIGAFYRVNSKQTAHDNLNKPGMEFKSFSLMEQFESVDTRPSSNYVRCYAYTVIARLAALAAAKELIDLEGE